MDVRIGSSTKSAPPFLPSASLPPPQHPPNDPLPEEVARRAEEIMAVIQCSAMEATALMQAQTEPPRATTYRGVASRPGSQWTSEICLTPDDAACLTTMTGAPRTPRRFLGLFSSDSEAARAFDAAALAYYGPVALTNFYYPLIQSILGCRDGQRDLGLHPGVQCTMMQLEALLPPQVRVEAALLLAHRETGVLANFLVGNHHPGMGGGGGGGGRVSTPPAKMNGGGQNNQTNNVSLMMAAAALWGGGGGGGGGAGTSGFSPGSTTTATANTPPLPDLTQYATALGFMQAAAAAAAVAAQVGGEGSGGGLGVGATPLVVSGRTPKSHAPPTVNQVSRRTSAKRAAKTLRAAEDSDSRRRDEEEEEEEEEGDEEAFDERIKRLRVQIRMSSHSLPTPDTRKRTKLNNNRTRPTQNPREEEEDAPSDNPLDLMLAAAEAMLQGTTTTTTTTTVTMERRRRATAPPRGAFAALLHNGPGNYKTPRNHARDKEDGRKSRFNVKPRYAADAAGEDTELCEAMYTYGRFCVRCANIDTPQWRSGPRHWMLTKPLPLCNACGVKCMHGRLADVERYSREHVRKSILKRMTLDGRPVPASKRRPRKGGARPGGGKEEGGKEGDGEEGGGGGEQQEQEEEQAGLMAAHA